MSGWALLAAAPGWRRSLRDCRNWDLERTRAHQLVVVPVVARVEASIRDLNVRAAIAGFRLEPSDSKKIDVDVSVSDSADRQLANSKSDRNVAAHVEDGEFVAEHFAH